MVLAAVAAAVVDNAVEGAILLALFSTAGTLEHRAMGKARRAVEALMALRPDSAFLVTPEGVVEVPVEELRPGQWVILRLGARAGRWPHRGRRRSAGRIHHHGGIDPGPQGARRAGA